MKMKLFVIILDVCLLLLSVKGIDDLSNYYVPWEAQPTVDEGKRTNVRAGPSTSYDILFKLPIEPNPAKAKIIGELNDWYRLTSENGAPCAECKFKTVSKLNEQCKDLGPGEICEPGGMVRKDTMEKIRTDEIDIIRVLSYMMQNPPWPLVAIFLLWFWPRVRSRLCNSHFKEFLDHISKRYRTNRQEQSAPESSNAETPP